MCPLRLILIFLSATLAGFFVIRNLKSQPQEMLDDNDNNDDPLDSVNPPSVKGSSKVFSVIGSGFWTCVDMASGRYLWKHLVSSSKRSN